MIQILTYKWKATDKINKTLHFVILLLFSIFFVSSSKWFCIQQLNHYAAIFSKNVLFMNEFIYSSKNHLKLFWYSLFTSCHKIFNLIGKSWNFQSLKLDEILHSAIEWNMHKCFSTFETISQNTYKQLIKYTTNQDFICFVQIYT